MTSFKNKFSFVDRKAESTRIKSKYSDRIPVIAEKGSSTDNIPASDKRKLLVPKDLTVGEFIYVIRNRITLSSDQALFLFFNKKLYPSSSTMAEVHEKEKDEDGFLYCVYTGEQTFG